MAVSYLIAAADSDVVAGLDAGELIALLALCVSAGSAWFSWHAWRRAPGSDIELRQISVRRDRPVGVAFACIAVNRSPHAAKLTGGVVRCRLSPSLSASISMGGVTVSTRGTEPTAAAAQTEPAATTRTSVEISAGVGRAGVAASLGAAESVAVLLEGDLAPEEGAFPVTIPPAQGVPLIATATVPDGDQLLQAALDVAFEVVTSDGLAFTGAGRTP